MTIILFALISNTFAANYDFPQARLDDYDMYQVYFAVVHDETIFMGNKHHLLKTNMNAELISEFNAKGRGPMELVSGGPIFVFQGKLWCHDIFANELVVFDDDLNVIGKKQLPGNGRSRPFPGKDAIFVVDYPVLNAKTEPLIINKCSPSNLELEKKYSVAQWEPQFEAGGLFSMNQVFDNTFALYETVQNNEKYRLLIWNADTGETIILTHFTPSYNKTAKITNRTPAFTLRDVTFIKSVFKSGEYFVVFQEVTKKKGHGGRDSIKQHYVHIYNAKTGAIVENRQVPYRILAGPGNADVVLLQHQDEGYRFIRDGILP